MGLDRWVWTRGYMVVHGRTGAAVLEHALQYRGVVLPLVLVTCAVLADAECRSAAQIRVSVDGLVFPIDEEI